MTSCGVATVATIEDVRKEIEKSGTDDLPDPEPVSDIKPKIQFCMPDSKEVPFKYNDSMDHLFKQHQQIQSARSFIFITHGFRCSMKTEWMTTMKNAIFEFEEKSGRMNTVVAIVGWGVGARARMSMKLYIQPASNTQSVGAWLGEKVKELCVLSKSYNNDVPDVIGIGHSLGAHLMGAAGRTSRSFGEIIGLDPAGPKFETQNQRKRLCSDDAEFVQVIHTDGATLVHFGTLIPLGQVDFYPNKGFNQPGANYIKAGSHKRAVKLLIWSITNPGRFKTDKKYSQSPDCGKPAEMNFLPGSPLVEMGYHNNRNVGGCYYLKTGKKEPWDVC